LASGLFEDIRLLIPSLLTDASSIKFNPGVQLAFLIAVITLTDGIFQEYRNSPSE
jgi:hypothetical protein